MAEQQGLVRGEQGTGDAVASGAADLTAAYLTAALRPSMPGADVTDVRAERIGTGQIGASYRLHLGGNGVPATLVAKLAADDPASRERVKDGYRKEVRFYRELGERVAGHVPGCWHAAIADDASTFTLLLDDLAPAVPGVQANGCTVDEAAAAVRNLAGVHAATWCDDALLAARWLQAWEPETGRFLGDVLVGANDEFVARYGDALGPEDVDTIRRAAASTGAWAAAPVTRFTVVHGDYRLDNLMFSPDGTVTALDWQTATMGSPMRDLAYFLETSLDVELRRRHERQLLGIYADALVEGGVERGEAEESLERYPDDLRQGPLITVLGAVYATATRSDAADGMFLAMARRSCAALRDHGVLEGGPRHMGDASPRGFWMAAREEPDRVAVVDPDGREWTAGELLAGADQLVHALRARGVREHDPVATLTANRAELLQTLLAIFQAGWQYVPLNTSLTVDEVGYILADSGAKALVADERHGDVAAAAADAADLAADTRIALGEIPGFVSFADLIAGQPTTRPPDRVAGQFMQYTSGTTGRPKAVQRDLMSFDPETWVGLYSANLTRYDIEPGGDAVHLVVSPMYHLSPLSFGYFSLHLEHTVVLMERFDAERVLQLIDQHRVTDVATVPTQMHRLMQLPADVRGRYDVSSLRQVIHAAAPCPVELKRRMFDWLGPVIYEFYGATEGGGTLAKPHDWLAHPGTVGRPWDGAGVKVLDDDGNELGPGEVGAVYLKLMGEFAYKGDPGKTAANRHGDYFTVGDLGELDDEGFLYLRDRKIDMIISGGVNVYPAEIEGVLLAHPKVGDAAVFGVPDEEWGEEVKAVVEPAPGVEASDELARELLAHCDASLARYKRPRTVDFTDAMPRDPNGKLYKRRLRDPHWTGRERSI